MRVLIVDDEESMRHMLSVVLKQAGYSSVSTENGIMALEVLEKAGGDFDFILSDIKMPVLDGLGLLKKLKKREEFRDITVVMMSAYGTIDDALECMKEGAYDYISKPFKSDEIVLTLKKAQERERLKRENVRLKSELGGSEGLSGFYCADEKMKEIVELVKKVSDVDSTVLVTGETGTGKELIARAIHFEGSRKEAPFVALNCGAIAENLLESELFGHVKGAFTDATLNKDGLFKEADGGTIFLDEIGELPKDLQVKLLRVLQESEIRRVGDTKDIEIDVRVVAATARNLEEEVKEGHFREDLFYRLNVLPIKIPPLRERPKDIEGLAELFVGKYSSKFTKKIKGLDKRSLKLLKSYKWPGNVRELENVIERAVILEESDLIGEDVLPVKKGGVPFGSLSPSMVSKIDESYFDAILSKTSSIKAGVEALEREFIKRALETTNGNKTKAAELLEISNRALLYKVKNYKL